MSEEERQGNRIVKNTGYLLGSQSVTWILSLLVMIVVPRYFGSENFGIMHLSNSIWAIGIVIVGFGTDVFVTREVARAKDKIPELFWTSLIIHFGMLIVVFLGIMAYALLTQDDMTVIYVIAIGGLVNALVLMIVLFEAILHGLDMMGQSSAGMILRHSITVGTSLGMVALGFELVPYLLINALVQIPALIYFFSRVRAVHKLPFRFNWPFFRWTISESFPNLLASLFRTIYANIDAVLMVSLLGAFDQVGWYSVADRLTGTSLFIPTALIAALFPSFSRYFISDQEELGRLFRRSFNVMTIVSIPVGLGVVALATPAVVLIYGEDFRNAGPILSVMGVVIIFLYINTFIGSYLIATDRQRVMAWLLFGATLLTIPLDLIFLPLMQNLYGNGAIGGGLAYIVTEGLMMGYVIWLIRDEHFDRENVTVALKALVSGLMMLAAVWLIRDMFIAIPVVVGGIVYVGLMLIIRGVPDEEMNIFKEYLFKVVNRVRNRVA